ncbi:hypothetical protein C9374_011835 [Naegleria lovaniensis]|uniref:N-acetyltransferase domain-containing protein n=1 Tax=Naegleria lovaniensis TaxID=51637 RepID=A0AA88KF38_NAELO|nr:uncharacterized protein C9374_011835 [Naegleria lovaniensis]KAG2373746.1 hypothetical protein C9374_011835 [Naegleria lovaniensis]
MMNLKKQILSKTLSSYQGFIETNQTTSKHVAAKKAISPTIYGTTGASLHQETSSVSMSMTHGLQEQMISSVKNGISELEAVVSSSSQTTATLGIPSTAISSSSSSATTTATSTTGASSLLNTSALASASMASSASSLETSPLSKDLYYTVKDKTFRFLSLRDNFSLPLLTKIYNEIMIPNFPIESELDPLEVWINNLTHKGGRIFVPLMHIMVAFEIDSNDNNALKDENIAGISVFEYYEMSQCALLSYFVVCEKYRNYGLGKTLVYQAYEYCKNELYAKRKANRWEALNNALMHVRNWHVGDDDGATIVQLTKTQKGQLQFAQQYIQLCLHNAQLKAQNVDIKHILDSEEDEFYFFAETNAIGVHDGVMASEQRHKIMRNIGFCVVDFEYIQPPVCTDEDAMYCDDLLLLSLEVENDRCRIKSTEPIRHVPRFKLKCWTLELLYTVFREIYPHIFADYFQYQWQDLDARGPRIPIFTDLEKWKRRTRLENYKRDENLLSKL